MTVSSFVGGSLYTLWSKPAEYFAICVNGFKTSVQASNSAALSWYLNAHWSEQSSWLPSVDVGNSGWSGWTNKEESKWHLMCFEIIPVFIISCKNSTKNSYLYFTQIHHFSYFATSIISFLNRVRVRITSCLFLYLYSVVYIS